MKVLLIQPPHYFDGKSRRPGFFPVGLGYLVARLWEDGHDVEVFDIWAKQLTYDEVVKEISKLDYDIVGITALSTQYNYVCWLVTELKRHKDTPIILGGPLATFSPKVVLENTLVDICVISEGDVSFPNLLRNLGAMDVVNGIVYRKEEGVIFTPPQEYVRDLDSLGFAVRDRDLFDTDIYLNEGYLDGYPNIKAMNVMTNRGCPYSCGFCSKTFHHVRSRSIQHIQQEIEMLIEEFGVGAIFFNDELLVLNRKRIYDLCAAIKPLNILWQGQARVDIVDYDILRCMKDAGCVSVGLGIESGSQSILNAMKKRTTIAQNLAAVEAAKAAGLDVIVQCIYGYIGENDGTIAETIKFFQRADLLHQGFFVLTPLPGSSLYQQCLDENIIVDEHDYLFSLGAGYNTESDAVINLTSFSTDEFYIKKHKMEDTILRNYFLKHPFQFVVVRDEYNNLRRIPLAWHIISTMKRRLR